MAPVLTLTGFMGSGKSSVGKQVATLLGWEFVDLDGAFVEAESKSIEDFFVTEGETAFRARECELLESVLAQERDDRGLVVALGGGTLESPRASELLGSRGGLVFLDIDSGEAWARVEGSGRPLATEIERFRSLLARRRKTYESAADWVVPVENRTVESLAEEIVDIVETAGKNWQTQWGRHLASTERSSLVVGGVAALDRLQTLSLAVREAGCRVFVITDENVARAWGDRVLSLLGKPPSGVVLIVEPGEGSKSARTLERCWDFLAGHGARRDDVVLALGGGVVGDLAGFAAATYQRGVALWQIPTSLLAQVDSSVGGKTAINLEAGKNLVGAFYQPDLVLADPVTLTTLPHSEYVGGLGEVVKHGLLISDAFFGRLEAEAEVLMQRDPAAIRTAVKASVAYKASVVEQDEREGGKRAALNLGHTIGHAIEVVNGYGAIGHGQAVSLGLLVALAVSERLLGLDTSVRERTRALLGRFGLPTSAQLPATEILLSAAGRDKKARAGTSGFVGLRAIGDAVWGMNVSGDELTEALEVIRQ